MTRAVVRGAASLAVVCALWAPRASAGFPGRLTDAEFRRAVSQLSEPGGFFRSDNLVSNEDTYQQVLPDLARTVKPGGVYLGVGPDQNFTYIAALQPRIAFITDIRRGNLHVHLMYKALFELSDDRVAFLSRLFSRREPRGLPSSATSGELLRAIAAERPSPARLAATRHEVIDVLERRHGFPLEAADTDGIAYVLEAFSAAGPEISYSNTTSGLGRYPTFRDLQIADDGHGVQRGYLASEANFRAVRSLEQRNLIVPVVGDFAGPKAIRAIGEFVRERGGTVTAFYTSNVEQYLFQDGTWGRFAENVASLPLDASSTFIRSCFNNNCATSTGSRSMVLLDPIASLLREVDAGRISSYSDVLAFRR